MTPTPKQVSIADYNPPLYIPAAKQNIFAKSKAYRKIYDELFNYTTGRLKGGSVLISGHRGAGKTTLINNVIDELKEILRERQIPYKPLFVPLHGPDLLEPDRTEKPIPEKSPEVPSVGDENSPNNTAKQSAADAIGKKETSGSKPDKPVDKSKESVEKAEKVEENKVIKNVLENLTIALYRSLADEFFETFQEKVETSERASELNELVGLLRLELDESSDVSTLRAIWDEAGFLQKGLLFENRQPDQGVQEIVLLSSAAQAFRIVAGSITDSEDLTNKTNRERIVSSEYKLISREIVNGVLSLASGAAVGFGVANIIESDLKILIGGLAGIITALLSGYTFTASTKTTTNKESSRQYKFIRNTDISSLNRELPNLIKRMKSLGLAPVFVIDELDKVIPPYGDFGDLIGYLKNLVNDHSFFCFLTDRSYFDFLDKKYRENKYPREYTYFRNRFYVNYLPADLHSYLNELFQLQTITDQELKADAILMEYLLLNRANLHTIDLRRELLRRADEGVISLEDIKTKTSFRFTIMMQLAIESIIEENELTERYDDDTYFFQLVTDTMYYPMRKWATGEPDLDLRQETFEKYMKSRSEFYSGNDKKTGSSKLSEADYDEHGTIRDLDFLRKKLIQLVQLLLDGEKLSKRILSDKKIFITSNKEERDTILTIIANSIPKNEKNDQGSYGLLIRKDNEEEVYEWCYEYYGTNRRKHQELRDIGQKIKFLEELSDVLKLHSKDEVDFTLLARARVINTSPYWDDILRAIPRMKEYVADKEKKYPGLLPDTQSLGEFFDMIVSRSIPIAKSFALADAIRFQLENFYWRQIFEGLRIFDWNSPADGQKIDSLLKEAGINENDWSKYVIRPGNLSSWTIEFKNLFKNQKYLKRSKDEIHKKWWETWRQRLLENIKLKKEIFEITFDDILCRSEGYSLAKNLPLNVDSISKETWSDIVLNTWKSNSTEFSNIPAPAFHEVPDWMMKAALIQLGFTGLAFNLLDIRDEEWKSIDQSLLVNTVSTANEFAVVVTQPSQYSSFDEIDKPFLIVNYPQSKELSIRTAKLIEYIRKTYTLRSLVIDLESTGRDKIIAELMQFFVVEQKDVFIYAPQGRVKSQFKVVRTLKNIFSSAS